MVSAPVKVLDLILHGWDVELNSDVLLVDYRDKESFSALWLNAFESGKLSVAGKDIDLTDLSKQILVIGNDPPDGIFNDKLLCLKGINFRSHFTATSWLAAWKVKFTPTDEERKVGKTEAMARIAVIDPGQPGMASGTASPLQTILGACDTRGNSLVPRANVLNAPSLESICQWLSPSQEDLNRHTPEHLCDLLKSTIWNGLTSNREQHHALSNVLGAFLLSLQGGSGANDPGELCAQSYLLALVQACGIEVDLGPLRQENHQGFQGWLNSKQQKTIGGALLIDDMGELWEPFLRGALGFTDSDSWEGTGRSYRESFEYSGGTSFREEIVKLPGRLLVFLESGKRRLRATDLLGSPTKIDENFVLFLDLRLFATSDARLAERYYEELRSLAKRVLAAPALSRPWLDVGTISNLEEELDGTGGHATETLLPRLISLLDPTLPIVIFSSTHRTELIDPFREYGNIIVDFRKPVLSGMTNWDASVRELHNDFKTAMETAAGVLSTRKLLADLEPGAPLAI